ncbi:MAG TPA: tripartite tricarboxylate transporter substrate-binding protein [Deinococcales bacterium]|nr:tripartite tricarboxylate transporter substrate-binding protein [Deinococcales bacterium]
MAHRSSRVRLSKLVRGVATAALALTLAAGVSAQGTLGSLRIMAPAAPGGGWDQTSRALQSVIQDNKLAGSTQVFNVPGAGGTIGLAQLVNARGDGNLLMTMGLVMTGAILTNNSRVNLSQVTPIARLTGEYEVIVVPAASRFQSMADLVAAWKADPGKVAFAGGSAGGTDHILVGLLAQAVGVDTAKINYVPFSGGGEALAALLGNQVAAGVSGYGEFEAQIKAGTLRALAISSKRRLAGINIPTLIEQKINVDLANWRGVVAAPGITAAQRQALLDLVDRIHKSKQWQDTLKARNWEDLYLPGSRFEVFLAVESDRIAKTLKSIGLVK